MPKHLRLISHKLCPYVQRAVIVANEKEIGFERVDIDLSDKPDWFLQLSPTGKVPVLEVTLDDGSRTVLFESAVIAEYLDEISEGSLLPAEPLARARERAWIEFASALLGDLYRFYTADDEGAFEGARTAIDGRLAQIGGEFVGPWFNGDRFGLADAAFAPAFRYFDVFDRIAGVDLLERHPRVRGWANALLKRPSVRSAVPTDYAERLSDFVRARNSHLGALIDNKLPEAA